MIKQAIIPGLSNRINSGTNASVLSGFANSRKSTEKSIFVGIPALNEERSIESVIVQAKNFSNFVIVCDDGSDDRTATIAENLGAYVVRHEKNIGYGAAIKSLFGVAIEFGADALVTIDGDGQHDATEIPSIAKAILDGSADIVIGSRFLHSLGTAEMPLYRRLGIRVITKLINTTAKTHIQDSQSGFRAYSRHALTELNLTKTGMDASIEILFDASDKNLRVTEIPSSCIYNTGNPTSTQNPIKQGLGLVFSLFRLKVKNTPLKNLRSGIIFSFLIGCFIEIQARTPPKIAAIVAAVDSITFPLIGVALFRLLHSNRSIPLEKNKEA